MNIDGASAVVTGGASGLGLATVKRLLDHGAHVVIADLPTSAGESVAAELGPRVQFAAADVRSTDEVSAALDLAAQAGPVRAVVHCAGRGGPVRVVDKNGEPGSLELYTEIVTTNLIGSFNVLRLAGARGGPDGAKLRVVCAWHNTGGFLRGRPVPQAGQERK